MNQDRVGHTEVYVDTNLEASWLFILYTSIAKFQFRIGLLPMDKRTNSFHLRTLVECDDCGLFIIH